MPRRNHSKSVPQGRKQFKLSMAMVKEFRELEAESIAVDSMTESPVLTGAPFVGTNIGVVLREAGWR